jgi:hypothetical protein
VEGGVTGRVAREACSKGVRQTCPTAPMWLQAQNLQVLKTITDHSTIILEDSDRNRYINTSQWVLSTFRR